MVNQYELEIQQYTKTEGNLWIYRVYESIEDTVKFASIDVEMTVAEIYEGVLLEEVELSEL